MKRNKSRALVVSCLLLAAGTLTAQDGKDWDIDLKSTSRTNGPGDSFTATVGLTARRAGVQGWSYGVKHDTSVLTIQSVTSAGTDVPSVFKNGFNQTTLIEEEDSKTKTKTNVGFIQAIVLSLSEKAEVPVSAFFSMAEAKYVVSKDACNGKSGDFKTKIEFTEELGVPGSPPVDLNITVDGKSLVPADVSGEEITVKCAGVTPGGFVLEFDDSKNTLTANKSSTYDLKVLLKNSAKDEQDVQGWSYGVKFDAALVMAVSGEPGKDAKALNKGDGPEFTSYSLDEKSQDGKERGVTVGAVIEIDEPGTEVLTLKSGQSKHIDTIKLRSNITIPEGGQSKTATIGFSDKLGGDRPLEVLIVVEGEGIVPDFGDTLALTLQGGEGGAGPRFIRGDANSDARVDIADGIWLINDLFYSGPETRCQGAADSNDDDRVDLADAMYIFNWQLQPGRSPGNLAPPPPAPFPNCGTDSDVSAEECPDGSTTCNS